MCIRPSATAVRAARRSPGVAIHDIAATAGISTETLRGALAGLGTRGGCGQAAARLAAAGDGAAVVGLTHRGCPPPATRLAAEPSAAGGHPDIARVSALTGTAGWAVQLPPDRARSIERYFLAHRVACPPRLTTALAQDTDSYVRQAVAARTDCPTVLVPVLAQDTDPRVVAVVVDRLRAQRRA